MKKFATKDDTKKVKNSLPNCMCVICSDAYIYFFTLDAATPSSALAIHRDDDAIDHETRFYAIYRSIRNNDLMELKNNLLISLHGYSIYSIIFYACAFFASFEKIYQLIHDRNVQQNGQYFL